MWSFEQLSGCLTEVVDELLHLVALSLVFDRVKVNCTFVCQMIKYIQRLLGLFSLEIYE